MPRTGRPRKPAAVHKLQGSYREDRHGPLNAIPTTKPKCPAWVSLEAAEHWGLITEILASIGVMADAYTPSVTLLVESWAKYLKLRNESVGTPTFIATDKGNLIIHPLVAAERAARKQCLELLRDHGLTPATAKVLSAKAAEPSSKSKSKARFIGGPRLAV